MNMMNKPDKKIESCIKDLLRAIGEKPSRPGLKDTPARTAKAWKEWTRGYKPFPQRIVLFPVSFKGLVVRKGIPFSSTCEHHLAQYIGTMDFGYVPDKQVIGISKIIRILQHYSARLTIQEQLTQDLLDKFVALVKPQGAIIKMTGFHTCEGTRGVKVPNVPTITTAAYGVLKKDTKTAHRFYSLVK